MSVRRSASGCVVCSAVLLLIVSQVAVGAMEPVGSGLADLMAKLEVVQKSLGEMRSEYHQNVSSVVSLSRLSGKAFENHRSTKYVARTSLAPPLAQHSRAIPAFIWGDDSEASGTQRFCDWVSELFRTDSRSPINVVFRNISSSHEFLTADEVGLSGGTDIGLFGPEIGEIPLCAAFLKGCIELKKGKPTQADLCQTIGEAMLVAHHTDKGYWCFLTDGHFWHALRVSGFNAQLSKIVVEIVDLTSDDPFALALTLIQEDAPIVNLASMLTQIEDAESTWEPFKKTGSLERDEARKADFIQKWREWDAEVRAQYMVQRTRAVTSGSGGRFYTPPDRRSLDQSLSIKPRQKPMLMATPFLPLPLQSVWQSGLILLLSYHNVGVCSAELCSV